MDFFNLLIRLIGFAVTLYFLLEFAVVCSVNTNIASILVVLTVIAVVGTFFILKRYNVVKCTHCDSYVMPKLKFGN